MIKIPKNESLNIVPFIDIMLVLLAIVLSVSTFIAQGKIQIELPQSANQEQQKDEKKVKVLINKENQIYLDDSLVGLEELKVKLESLEAKTMVELHSDKDAKFETFIQIVDILKGKGHENFSIATQQQ
ncbi:TonB system transport protein ExbD [Helicobacter pullorum]|uniref:Biopolymer transport protein ExbD n=2 Tax=Helicobacter pullorum TaxID=35818 RepID=A0A0N1MPS2_9HELI|nr:TonB system transport protein ExbD [Helicobacter pullorum]HIS08284.1 TonB system transport protein ExbD [Candidatus Scatomorpha intestinipullorum]EEQ62651.1 TonB system transport protein ExbD [Helicobacter pullorum MIT 98-5489]KAB0576113.1 TonB system transport protein ExbD [Helicobacter pullorum NCTC 12824]KPH51430.1 biopolymer transporter ExbD [Helicobacter pullorum]KPH54574.1 biopolymer transporter ExbD [Helicobacter pullorum]